MIEFSVRSVRELKGPALSCLVLLSLVSSPVSQEWLERSSGYTDKPVSQALSYLRENGFVARGAGGWVLAEGFQLPLGAYAVEGPSRSFSDSGSSTVLVVDVKSESISSSSRSRKFSDSELEEVKRVLWRASIGWNDRVEAMLELPHVTLPYLLAKTAEFKAAGKGGSRWAGLLIRVIEAGEPVAAAEQAESVSSKVAEFLKAR